MPQENTAQLVKELRNARRLFGPDWAKRIAAAQALGAQRAGEAVSDLAAVVQENQNPDLVQAALQALGQIATPQAVDALIAILCGSDVKQSELASQLLVSLGPQIAGRALLSTSVSSATTNRNAAENVLRQYGDITPLLISLLDESDSALRDTAQQRLTQSGPAIVPALLRASIHPSLTVRQAVNEVLSSIGNTTALLVELLDDKDDQIRDIARDRLLQGGSGSIPALLNAVSGDAHNGQTTAADVLALIGATAIPAICEAAHRTSGPGRVRLVRALGGFGQPAIDCLIAVMKDPDLETSRAAGETLAGLGQVAVPVLIDIQNHGDQQTRELASDSLAKMGAPAAQALLELLGKQEQQERARTLDILRRIDAPERDMLLPFFDNWRKANKDPQVVVVDPSGKGDFQNLAQAVAQAKPMSIVILAPGDHYVDTGLIIDTPLAILGSGMEHTKLLCNGSLELSREGVFIVDDEPLVDAPTAMHGIDIVYTGEEANNVLSVHIKIAHLNKCRVAGGTASAAEGGVGLVLGSTTQCKVTNCQFENNEAGAILVAFAAQPVIEDNSCRGQTYAIAYTDMSAGIARRNECSAPKGSSIIIAGHAQPVLEENTCRHSLAGIDFQGSSEGIARRNKCWFNKQSGVVVKGAASPLVESNSCGKNEQHGIAVLDTARPTLSDNRCYNNEMNGIYFFRFSSGDAKSNRCNGNRVGIKVDDDARPILEENFCDANGRTGIMYHASSGGIARRNQCNDNHEAGIAVADFAGPILQGNICRRNKVVGCLVAPTAKAVVKNDNVFSQNHQADYVDDR